MLQFRRSRGSPGLRAKGLQAPARRLLSSRFDRHRAGAGTRQGSTGRGVLEGELALWWLWYRCPAQRVCQECEGGKKTSAHPTRFRFFEKPKKNVPVSVFELLDQSPGFQQADEEGVAPTVPPLGFACHEWCDTGVFDVHRRDASPPPCPGDKARLLQQRLSSQERTRAFLLHQAFQTHGDIIAYLQGSKGYQHGETAAWHLLENHIQTITSIVKKLSQDIEVLEWQIRTRDGAAAETNFAVQTLDHKYSQCLGDLRGRVARCEASIAKLSGDISFIRHEAQKTDKEIYGLHSTLRNCVADFERKVMQLLGKMETSNSDQSSNLKTVQGDQHHKLQLLDFKLASGLSDFRDQIQAHRKWTESQLTRSEEDQAQQRHQLHHLVKERLEREEKRVEEKLLFLSLKLEQMDKPQKYEKQLNQMISDEKTLHERLTRFERQIWKEIEEIQNEYRSGFQSIHESLKLLRKIHNAKLKLEKKENS
ncbi:protein FAM81B [Neopsephotus bourkii]|uniref:protein FAM81B n=1 Tax=Neopsephotus bourkii TaxID=309878 RepID=UPI002AA5D893|nr:protein FAM81B [Neopsephotus bourkii]